MRGDMVGGCIHKLIVEQYHWRVHQCQLDIIPSILVRTVWKKHVKMSASAQQRPAEPETTHFDRPVLNTRVSEIKNKEIPATSGFDTPSSSDPRDPIEVEDLKRALAAKMQKMIERILALPVSTDVLPSQHG